MRRNSVHRLTMALLMVLSLLFSQLALASYVCPQQMDAQDMAAMVEAGLPCSGMDQDQPALCHAHAADPGKTFEAVKAPVVSLPMIVQVLVLPLVLEDHAAAVEAVRLVLEVRPPPDPLFLSTLRLRV